ncbi:hypothetical protein [Latilactobacillus fuchuensis]|uniref:hypothetical protein n=1 Tax=Latilactobacillus fuchuensis TaxID=164393 RepID=UPI0039AEF5B8
MVLDDKQKAQITEEYKNYGMDEPIRQYAVKRNNILEIISLNVTDKDKRVMKDFDNFRSKVQSVRNMHQLAIDSYFDLTKFHAKDNKASIGSESIDSVNRLVINFVSNVKLFMDFYEKWCKKNLDGKWDSWRKEESETYDKYLSYRLCYGLRNFVQHRGLPIASKKTRIIKLGKLESTMTDYMLNLPEIMQDNSFVNKLKIKQNYFEDETKLSFMPYANEYIDKINLLYIIGMRFYIGNHRDFLIGTQVYFQKRELKENYFWSDVTKAQMLQGELLKELNPMITLATVDRLVLTLGEEGIIDVLKQKR